jgi:hypothetical protein
MWKEFYTIRKPEGPSNNAHRREAFPMFPVWKWFYPVRELEKA